MNEKLFNVFGERVCARAGEIDSAGNEMSSRLEGGGAREVLPFDDQKHQLHPLRLDKLPLSHIYRADNTSCYLSRQW